MKQVDQRRPEGSRGRGGGGAGGLTTWSNLGQYVPEVAMQVKSPSLNALPASHPSTVGASSSWALPLGKRKSHLSRRFCPMAKNESLFSICALFESFTISCTPLESDAVKNLLLHSCCISTMSRDVQQSAFHGMQDPVETIYILSDYCP